MIIRLSFGTQCFCRPEFLPTFYEVIILTYKVIEIVQYALYDDGDYYDESFEDAREAIKACEELEGKDYVKQCWVNLDKPCNKCDPDWCGL